MVPTDYLKTYWKKTAGIALILLGIFALITPLTPGSWLVFVGAEMLGFRLAFWEKWKAWWNASRRGARETQKLPPE